ncbi:MAG: serine/threonine protein phosphatase [Gemmataceae bacterium]|nr:serine/threonine protein phosphatase [Gemmataceae bacterium]
MLEPGRLFALGDVHGCLTALEAVLRAADLQPDDRVIGLGDYVDRGPSSRGVLDFLIGLFEAGRLIPLRGNHELMMCRARDSLASEKFWCQYGGDATLRSYAPQKRPGRLADVPDRHWRFIASECQDYFETVSHIFVHAGAARDLPLDSQLEEDLFWRPFDARGGHTSGRTIVCGHTTQHGGLPLDIGHTICIDTGAYSGGWLTLLDVATGRGWQARESGEVRGLEMKEAAGE